MYSDNYSIDEKKMEQCRCLPSNYLIVHTNGGESGNHKNNNIYSEETLQCTGFMQYWCLIHFIVLSLTED